MSEFNSLQLNSCGPFEPPNRWANPLFFSSIDNYAPLPPPLPSPSLTSSSRVRPQFIHHAAAQKTHVLVPPSHSERTHITSSTCEESDACPPPSPGSDPIQALLMSDSLRRSVVLVWLCLLLISVISSSGHGARDMQVFKEKPPCGRRNFGYFMGYLPKAMPIPPSAPSKQHNAIGLEKNATP